MAGREISVRPRVDHTSIKLAGHHIPSPPPPLTPSITVQILMLHVKSQSAVDQSVGISGF